MGSQTSACTWYFSNSDGFLQFLENVAFDFCEKERSGRGRTARSDMQSCHRAHISAQSRGRLAKPLRVRRARTNGKQRAGRYLPDEDCSGLTLSEGTMFLRFPMKKTRKGARILSRRRSPVPGCLAPLPFAPWRLEAQDQVPAFPNGKEKERHRNSVPAPFPFFCFA